VDVVGDAPRSLSAREIIVATGSAPRALPDVPVDGTHVITSDHAIALEAVPESVAIIGSGAVGVEFASIFQRFGSRVTIVEMMPAIVPVEDAAVSAELARVFRKRGIDVKTSRKVTTVDIRDGRVQVTIEGPDGTSETIEVEKLLVAAGRSPVTAGLGAEEAGLAIENGFIRVDELYRTNVSGISAIGDVIAIGERPHPQLAHVS